MNRRMFNTNIDILISINIISLQNHPNIDTIISNADGQSNRHRDYLLLHNRNDAGNGLNTSSCWYFIGDQINKK